MSNDADMDFIAQAMPACSQADVASSQSQRSTAKRPVVAHRKKAKQAKNLERAASTSFRIRAA